MSTASPGPVLNQADRGGRHQRANKTGRFAQIALAGEDAVAKHIVVEAKQDKMSL